jgi:hypothetical protein
MFPRFLAFVSVLVFGVAFIVLPVSILVAMVLVRLFRARVKWSMQARRGASSNREGFQPIPHGPILDGSPELLVLLCQIAQSSSDRTCDRI